MADVDKIENKIISVRGTDVTISRIEHDDYICLTDMAKHKNAERPGLIISHWLSTVYTVNFLRIWEQVHNPSFKLTEFREFKTQLSEPGFALSAKQWIEQTDAIGIISKRGRYGGTYAHRHIAFEFASWISPEFKYYLIAEFERLKSSEQELVSAEWNLQRLLAKVNYQIHTDAIKDCLIPTEVSASQASYTYANEADLLNVALFGFTAAQWRDANPDAHPSENVRGSATLEQLVVLSNMESINALLIRQDLPQSKRLQLLNQAAITQMTSLLASKNLHKLPVTDRPS